MMLAVAMSESSHWIRLYTIHMSITMCLTSTPVAGPWTSRCFNPVVQDGFGLEYPALKPRFDCLLFTVSQPGLLALLLES